MFNWLRNALFGEDVEPLAPAFTEEELRAIRQRNEQRAREAAAKLGHRWVLHKAHAPKAQEFLLEPK